MSTVDIQYKLIIIKLFWSNIQQGCNTRLCMHHFICVNVIEWARFGDACSKFNDKAIFRLYAIKNLVAWTILNRLFLVLKFINQATWIIHTVLKHFIIIKEWFIFYVYDLYSIFWVITKFVNLQIQYNPNIKKFVRFIM